MITTLDFNNDYNIGLFGFATDEYAICSFQLPKEINVSFFKSKIFNTYLIGLFLVGNKNGIILPSLAENEKKCFEKITNVYVLKTRYTALGNLILMNDNGILVSPLLKKHVSELKEFFEIPCKVTTIASLNTIGACAIATNKGCAVNPEIKKEEKDIIEEVLGVECKEATVSFGSPYVGVGVIANSFSCFVASDSTGIELGLIGEALKL